MSQYSPTVNPTWGEAFSRALMAPVDSYLLAKRQRKDDAMHMLGLGYQPDDGTQPNGPRPVHQSSDSPVNPGSSGSRFRAPMATTPMMVPPDQRNDPGAMQNRTAFAQELGRGPIPDFKGRPRPGASLPIQGGDGGGLVGQQGAAALAMPSNVPPTRSSQPTPNSEPSQGINPEALDLLQSVNIAQRSAPKPQNFFASPADSTAYVQSRDPAQGRVRQLQSRADSLTGVLDRTTAQMQGGAQGIPAAPHGVDPVAAMNVELSSNQQRYANLLRAGADTA